MYKKARVSTVVYTMLLQQLTLVNIRSHTHSVVEFPAGLVLLAGDIGSGKSSILQAVEFALFGIRRGEVAGEGLLRHGEREGSVELRFLLGEQEVVVYRALKRTKDAVRQDTGWLEVGGVREELTAREIKARVIELLGYPDDLVSKSKGFVYRYTVYAPQEEMKQVIYESASNRLDVLRSVFDVDKYMRVVENASLVSKSLRDRKRYLQARIEDLPTVKEQLVGLGSEREELVEQKRLLTKQLSAKQDRLEELRVAGKELEESYTQEQLRREQLRGVQASIQSLTKQREQLSIKQERLQAVLAEEVEVVADPSPAVQKLRVLREKNQQAKTQAQTQLQGLVDKQAALEEEVAGVTDLEVCPKCQQPVTDDHKHALALQVKDEASVLAEEIAVLRERVQKASRNLEKLAAKESVVAKRESAYNAYQRAQQQLVSAREQLADVKQQQASVSEELVEKKDLLAELSASSFDQEAYDAHAKRVEEVRGVVEELRVEESKVSARLEALIERFEELEGRVEAMQAYAQELQLVSAREQWLSQVFVEAVSAVERLVLAGIHQEFSAKFSQWFAQLLGEDGLFADLDSSFAPRLTQDGYDVALASLSGGEKQSVALAYRLALNNVVNAVVRSLRTADLLVLDEPTDGFSDQQLDRVRDVLAQLPCEQVLLVSHEQKMQSFVDAVIEVVKREGVSHVS